jgi:hypothetical protein
MIIYGQKWERELMAMSDMESKEFRFKGCKFYNRQGVLRAHVTHEKKISYNFLY